MARQASALVVVALLAPIVAGCGSTSNDQATQQQEVQQVKAHISRIKQFIAQHQSTPTGGQGGHPSLIKSFDASLIRSGVVRLRWNLTRPVALSLVVSGIRHGSNHGQTGGIFAIPPSDAAHQGPAGEGTGTARINFEYGEVNFRDYKRIQFRLRAQRHRVREVSEPVIVRR